MLTGIAWYGEVVFIVFILIPSLSELTEESKKPLMIEMFPRIFRVATVTSATAIFSGAAIALLYTKYNLLVFLRTSWGLAILVGGTAGLIMFLVHMTVETTALRQVRRAKAKTQETFPEELKALERRIRLLPRVGFLLLNVTLVLMIYASHGI